MCEGEGELEVCTCVRVRESWRYVHGEGEYV